MTSLNFLCLPSLLGLWLHTMVVLHADSRYILLKLCKNANGEHDPFASARCVDVGEAGEDPVFDQISLHQYGRDVPSDRFLRMVPHAERAQAFVNANAGTLRELMGMDASRALGIDPALEFRWPVASVRSTVATELRESALSLSSCFFALLD